MAVYAGLVAGVPHLDYRYNSLHAGGAYASSSGVLDARHILRVNSVPKGAPQLCRSCVTPASLLTSTNAALSLNRRDRQIIKTQLLRSSWSLGAGNVAKFVLLHSYPFRSQQKSHGGVVVQARVTELASGIEVINNLGLDTLTFLGATVLIVPAFKAIKQSPILGFLLAGVVLNQLELIRSVTDVKALAELGILFLLFEMGLELSLARLKALAKFAFGIGLAQVVLSTLAFTAFELPPNKALGTRILEFLFHARPDLVNIRTVDEAVVIGAALSLSSSAFVLQLLAEKGELPTRFGSATLGILLLQDIAVVPLLVILPILETGNIADANLWPVLASESLKALLGLGLISLGGRLFLRRIFEIVANSRSSEAFVAMCLLTVTGTSFLTQKLGFSDTLGAFLAGALLAETNYRTQVEADIRPFRGLLLGLFFVTTGTSIDIQLLVREWPNVLALLAGLIAIKTAIITVIGPRVGLTLSESVRTGLLLSQGGEFAFVVFSLANRLGVLPLELNRLLIIVVVLSMALTPLLNELGRKAAEYIETEFEDSSPTQSEMQGVKNFLANEPVVIIGFGQMGQVLANFLSTPLATGLGGDAAGWPYVAFDLDPGRVKAACKLGFPVLYGDGSRPAVLHTAGITQPKAVMVMYTGRQKSVQAVERLRQAFPKVSIYARAQDLGHLLELKNAGITDSILENAETSLQLGSVLLRGLGVMSDDVRFLRRMMRESMELRALETIQKDNRETDWLVSFQAKVRQTWKNRNLKDDESVPNKKDLINEQAYLVDGNSALSASADAYSIQKDDQRKLNEKLPLLFAKKRAASQVQVSATGVLNGNASVSETEAEAEAEAGVMSSSAIVAVASPNGMLLEQKAQHDAVTDRVSDPEAQGLIVTVRPGLDNEPQAPSVEPTVSPAVQSASMGMAKLKWRTPQSDSSMSFSPAELDDERGVTMCALDDDGSGSLLEDGEELEKLDVTITALNRDDSK